MVMSTERPSRKGQPKGDKRERTRRTLITAAAELIARQGFDRTSLDDIARHAGMTRGAIHGNFESRDALFLAVMESQWTPVEAEFRPGAPLRDQMRILGQAVYAHARQRLPMAAGAAAFQLYLLTHTDQRLKAADRTAEGYRNMAQGFGRILPPGALPMPADRFVRILDAMITGLMFSYFQTPDLITEADMIAAFEALAGADSPPPAPRSWSMSAGLSPKG